MMSMLTYYEFALLISCNLVAHVGVHRLDIIVTQSLMAQLSYNCMHTCIATLSRLEHVHVIKYVYTNPSVRQQSEWHKLKMLVYYVYYTVKLEQAQCNFSTVIMLYQ